MIPHTKQAKGSTAPIITLVADKGQHTAHLNDVALLQDDVVANEMSAAGNLQLSGATYLIDTVACVWRNSTGQKPQTPNN